MGDLTEIAKIQSELKIYYDNKTFFREKGKIRLLQLYAGEYVNVDASRCGFVYESVRETGWLTILKKILSFKPDIILAEDATMQIRCFYDHEHILYINNNDMSPHVYLLPYIKMQKNEIHFYYWRKYYNLFGKLYGDDSIYQHIVPYNFVPGIVFFEPELGIPEEFSTDIVLVSASLSSASSTKSHIDILNGLWMKNSDNNCLKEKIKTVLCSMINIFYERMDKTGELITEDEVYIEEFRNLMGESLEQFQEISLENQQYFFSWFKLLVRHTAYRSLIAKWIVESGYKVELWGDSWQNEPELAKYYKGKIKDREELKKVYNRSKICLYTNPDFGIHKSVFEMIGSKSLCLAYHNENVSLASLEDYFQDGESIVLYKNRKELLEKIDFYLNHMDKREEIINRGYRIAKDQKLYHEYQLTAAVEKAVELAKENMGML